MPDESGLRAVVSNTSPLLYLNCAGQLDCLRQLCGRVRVPGAVAKELTEGQQRGYDVPTLADYPWLLVEDPVSPVAPPDAHSLGPGETGAICLALQIAECIVLLDDQLTRHVAVKAGLTVWGTLRVLLEAKSAGILDRIAPVVDKLTSSGMWLSGDIRQRILDLAGESEE